MATEQQKLRKLKVIKTISKKLKSGVFNIHGILPSPMDSVKLTYAIGILGQRLGEFVDGEYELYIESMGNRYVTYLGIKNVDLKHVRPKNIEHNIEHTLEHTLQIIIDELQNCNLTLYSDPNQDYYRTEMKRNAIKGAIDDIFKNNGSLPDGHEIRFFDTNFWPTDNPTYDKNRPVRGISYTFHI